VRIEFVEIEHLTASEIVQKVTALLTQKQKASGIPAAESSGGVSLFPDDRTNQVAVVGASAADVNEALSLLDSLDVSLGLVTKTYGFVVVRAERMDNLVKQFIGKVAAKRLYDAMVDDEANLLVATATPEIHERIESLREMLDKPVTERESPIRFYRLRNAKAAQVLETLRTIGGEEGLEGVSIEGISAEPKKTEDGVVMEGPTESQVNEPGHAAVAGRVPAGGAVEVEGARIMADESTNMIIVMAKPSMHPVYEKLINRLDVRRPQVLVTATVVLVDTTDGFSLGVEFSSAEPVDGGRSGTVLNFTQFGLSTVDAGTGRLTIRPGVGFNGALVSADIADIIIRALESDSRARVVSRPSLLINDNARGELASESEEPFSSVNASTTVATTSFAGYSKAGTNIVVEPTISEGDHLNLKYEIILSSFGDDGSDALPPPRQSNTLRSVATIPDGHTIIVGGLTREDRTSSIDRVPWVGRIPGIEYLFSSRGRTVGQLTLFVFIRAVILRDDKFKDLKALSTEAARKAGLTGDFPTSEPVEIQ
jgi:type II secretory pathway component GspD/PulD (secretin)